MPIKNLNRFLYAFNEIYIIYIIALLIYIYEDRRFRLFCRQLLYKQFFFDTI